MTPALVALQSVTLSPNLSGPAAGTRFEITEIPFVSGREYDQWKYVCRVTAERLAKAFPEVWAIEGDEMSTAQTVAQINAETMQLAPVALGTIIAVENAAGAKLPGDTKAQIVANSVLAGAQVVATSPNVTVASIGALTALLVSILNATGLFKHTASAAK